MSGCVRLGLRIYRFLLSFYPPIFRHEFGDEMQAVFTMVIFEAGKDTGGRLLRLCAREFRDWLGSVLREHLQERRGKMLSINGFGDEKPLRRSELLAALTIFLIPPLALVLVEILGRTPQLGSILLFLS